jgi:RNA polymerase sigma-70 factor (ECF subfamily)
MATEAISMLMEEPQVSSALPQSQPQPICPDVLGSIYADHYQYVLRVCRRFFRQPEDAEDAAAEVFLKLYRVLHQRDESMPFRPWVSQVAGRHCIDKLRQRKCERSSSLEDIDISGFADHSALSPLSEILRKDEQRQIREHLTRLPEKYKVPLVLLYYKRMSYSEIAGPLNTRLPAIRMISSGPKTSCAAICDANSPPKTSRSCAGARPSVV